MCRRPGFSPPPNWASNCASPRRENSSPRRNLLRRAGGKIVCTEDVRAAARGADLLYTDVWVSMGKEAESAERFGTWPATKSTRLWSNWPSRTRWSCTACPPIAAKKSTKQTFEANAATIFDQAENRLHCQKAIMDWLVG